MPLNYATGVALCNSRVNNVSYRARYLNPSVITRETCFTGSRDNLTSQFWKTGTTTEKEDDKILVGAGEQEEPCSPQYSHVEYCIHSPSIHYVAHTRPYP